MDERIAFIADHRQGLYSMTELCARYGVSRKTGYQVLDRFEEYGRRGLAERSRAPHHCPHRIATELADVLCATSRKHPDWGAGKLLDYLEPRQPDVQWPAVSTVHDLLARQGLVQRRRRRPHRTYGLPRAIRTDNGVPFATSGIHGLSQLNVWWMRLGIQHQRIHPGRPQENGAHERMHRTLKRGAIRPPRRNAEAQQRVSNHFRTEYNTERPHDHLGGATPASRYSPSPRAYPTRLPAQDYPGHFLVKKITTGGTFRFHQRLLFLAHSLTTHHIGLEETDDGIWSIYFNTVLLAKLDERDYIIRG